MSDSEEFAENFVVRDWDSQFFGFKVAQSELENATADEVRTMLSRCKSKGVRCLYFLADPANQETVSALTTNKFKLVDVRIQMVLRSPVKSHLDKSAVAIREASPNDADELTELSHGSFNKSRFYVDPGFSNSKCDELYAQWIRNGCSGVNGSKMFVAEQGGLVAGFWSCGMLGKVGRTGLTWLAPGFRGKGLSTNIFVAVENWLAEQRADSAIAVTQGTNVASVRMHSRCGFAFDSARLWFHRWF